MHLKNNEEQTENKKEEKFSKKPNEPTFDTGEDWLGVAKGKPGDENKEAEWPIIDKKPYTKDMYYIVLSRWVFNNKLNRRIVVADTMKQAVEDFLACKDDAEEFIMISKIEPDALSVIASTL